jgi:D-glycero-D-manno-heptose 1,7-bisphosphate phosphatase
MNCRGVVSPHSFRDVGTKERFATAGEFLSFLQRKIVGTLVILDRDDTLMRDPVRSNKTSPQYNTKILKKLIKLKSTDTNVFFVVISNQPAIAKGVTSFMKVAAENRKLQEWLEFEGVQLSGIEVCPHHPEKGFEGEVEELKIDCRCRKPSPGMVTDFVKRNYLNPTSIIVFGDSRFDYLLSRNLGCKFEWVRFGSPLLIARNCSSLLRTVVVEKQS